MPIYHVKGTKPMATEIVLQTDSELATDDPVLRRAQYERFEADAARTLMAGLPLNTYRSYRADFQHFKKWCLSERLPFLPTTEMALIGYVTSVDKKNESGKYPCRASTIERRISGIVWAHSVVNIKSPVTPRLSRIVQAVKRRRAKDNEEPPPKKAAPLLVSDLLQISAWGAAHSGPLVRRDVALVVLGWSCALRRAEISALDYSDVTQLSDSGFMLNIRHGKTDKFSEGFMMPVTAEPDTPETCPVVQLGRWLEVRGDGPGPLFWRYGGARNSEQRISGKSIGKVVCRIAAAAGIKTESVNLEFSGHSMRSGFITEAVREGHPHPDVMKRSRHKTYEVFLGYVNVVQTVDKNVATGFGKWGRKRK